MSRIVIPGILADLVGPNAPLITPDPNWADVYTLMKFNGTAGSKTITDDGSGGATWTSLASTVPLEPYLDDTAGKVKWPPTALYFPGGNFNRINTPDDYDFGTEDFTIEFWYRRNGNQATSATIFSTRENDPNPRGIWLFFNTAVSQNRLRLGLSTNTSSWDIAAVDVGDTTGGVFFHAALVREGSNFEFWLDGVSQWSTTNAGALYYDSADGWTIGSMASVSRYLFGHMDDFRITRGVARYTAAFTPPTASFSTFGIEWKASETTNFTISDSGRAVSNTGGSAGFSIKDWKIKSGSKVVVAFTIDDLANQGDLYLGIGLAGATSATAADSWSWRSNNDKYDDGVSGTYTGNWSASDVISLLIDTTTGKGWIAINGTVTDSGDPVAGTGETLTFDSSTDVYLLVACDNSTGTKGCTANVGVGQPHTWTGFHNGIDP